MNIYLEKGTFRRVYDLEKKYNIWNGLAVGDYYTRVKELYNSLSIFDSSEKKEEVAFLYHYYQILNCGVHFITIKEID